MERVNRIIDINSNPKLAQRADALSQLEVQIREKAEPGLLASEAQAIAAWLPSERDVRVMAFLWRLLLAAPPDERVKQFAIAWLERTGDPHRGSALDYLRTRYPEGFPALFDKYLGDPDANVKYVLAQYIQPSDPIRALDMMISALPNAGHELWDAIWLELAESGTQQQLATLRRMDRESGGKTGYATIADSLEAHLKNASKSR